MSRIFQILFLDCSLPICKNIIDFCLSCVLQPYFNIILSRVFCVNSLEFSTYNIMSFVNTDSFYLLYLSSVRSLSRIRLFATPWTAACQTSCPSPTPRACQTHVHRVVMPWLDTLLSILKLSLTFKALALELLLFYIILDSTLLLLEYWCFFFFFLNISGTYI